MLEFVLEYWVDFLFGLLIAGMSLAYKKLAKKVKEQEYVKEGVMAILHDRLFQAGRYYIGKDQITIDKTSMTQYGRIGYNAMGSQGTYACDGLYYNNKIVSNAMVGGSGGSSWRCGANYISFNVAATAAGGWSGGVGLSCEQKGGA